MKVIRFIHFITLTDTEQIEQCSRYDHHLMYAALLRQIVAYLFSFSVFIYGTLMFLPLSGAVLVSLLVSLTLFSIDQAIIGSEWHLKTTLFSQPWANYVVNLVSLPLKLLPRVLFSIAIAYVIATLAEIRVQHKAIDEVLQKQSQSLNSVYFKRLSEKQNAVRASLKDQQQEIDDIKRRIKEKRVLLADLSVDDSAKAEMHMNARANRATVTLENNTRLLAKHKDKLRVLKARLVEKKKLLEHWKNEKRLELTSDRGAKKGARWHAANKKVITIGQQVGELEAQVEKLAAYTDAYKKQVADSQNMRDSIRTLKASLGDESLIVLQQQLALARQSLLHKQAAAEQELAAFKDELKRDGVFYAIKDGPLGRYLALNQLYNDPEYGAAAQAFSYALKLVIILIELAPVLVMVFFSPYSFYAAAMRAKKQMLEHTMTTRILKHRVDESHKQSMLLTKEKTDERKRRFEATLDDNFNHAFNEHYTEQCA